MGVSVGVSVGVRVAVDVGVAVLVGDAVAVGVSVDVGEGVRLGVGVRVAVAVGVWVGVAVGVFVGVGVLVPVWVAVLVGVIVGVIVGVGVSVGPTKMLPLPGVQGTGVTNDIILTTTSIPNPQSVTCNGLFPSACPLSVTFTMLLGRAEATGVRHASEQMTRPTGGVGPGVAQKEEQLVKGD